MKSKLQEVAKSEGVAIDSSGIDAILQISKGDMRRALHLLQTSDVVNGELLTAYLVYGKNGVPSPSDIQTLLSIMMEQPLAESIRGTTLLLQDMAFSLMDVVVALHDALLNMDMSDEAMAFLTAQIANIEERLSQGRSEQLQLAALAGAFALAKTMTTSSPAVKEEKK